MSVKISGLPEKTALDGTELLEGENAGGGSSFHALLSNIRSYIVGLGQTLASNGLGFGSNLTATGGDSLALGDYSVASGLGSTALNAYDIHDLTATQGVGVQAAMYVSVKVAGVGTLFTGRVMVHGLAIMI